MSNEPSLGMLHGPAAPHSPSVRHTAPPTEQVPLAKMEQNFESQSKSATHGEPTGEALTVSRQTLTAFFFTSDLATHLRACLVAIAQSVSATQVLRHVNLPPRMTHALSASHGSVRLQPKRAQ